MGRAKRLLAVCHRRPDGDALGSTAAVLLWCRRQGIAAKAFCLDPIPPSFGFLPESERFTSDPAVFGEGWDTVVVLDCGDLQRIGHPGVAGGFPSVGPHQPPTVIAVDHHCTNDGRYADVSVIDPQASSTAELVLGMFRENGVTVDCDLATCLLAGVAGDTDMLTNPAACRSAFRMASELLSEGADWRSAIGLFVRNRSIPSLRLVGRAMARLKVDPQTGVASTAVFRSDCPDGSDFLADGLVDAIGGAMDAEVILVLKERADGTVSGSFRTVGEADTASVAQRLGGGGHRKASGFTVTGRIVEREHGWTVEREVAPQDH